MPKHTELYRHTVPYRPNLGTLVRRTLLKRLSFVMYRLRVLVNGDGTTHAGGSIAKDQSPRLSGDGGIA
ncbi:hypothetical protein BHE74_00049451 [Ensete ventricosum]|nr:hypothetical protein BHE74_00049451 [Ensete ventricosum]